MSANAKWREGGGVLYFTSLSKRPVSLFLKTFVERAREMNG